MRFGHRSSFDEAQHPRGGNPSNRGQFSTLVAADQSGSLAEHDPAVALDPYGRPNHCRWNEWYWTVRPHITTFRDDVDDATYNANHLRARSLPEPRNAAQIAHFWRHFDHTQRGSMIQSVLAERDSGAVARDFYMWESGYGLEELDRGSIAKPKQVRRFTEQCEEWARSIENPLHRETGANLYVALQMYTDARILDARNGKNPDDPDSTTHEIGNYWQSLTGRTPKDLVETCRLVHVLDLTGRLHRTETESLRRPRDRRNIDVWTGGRSYVKPVNPWRGITEGELF